ncbi:MAG: creatininase family protein, partial [Holdemanella porci]
MATTMCDYIEKELKAEDINLLLFPVGLSTEHKEFCGSITFKPMTYYHMLYDICVSLAQHGFKKIVLLVCHGGNAPVANLISREVR